jgi:hypothetical protein
VPLYHCRRGLGRRTTVAHLCLVDGGDLKRERRALRCDKLISKGKWLHDPRRGTPPYTMNWMMNNGIQKFWIRDLNLC